MIVIDLFETLVQLLILVDDSSDGESASTSSITHTKPIHSNEAKQAFCLIQIKLSVAIWWVYQICLIVY